MKKWSKINFEFSDWFNNYQSKGEKEAETFVKNGGYTHYMRYPSDVVAVAYGLPDNGYRQIPGPYGIHMFDHGTAYKNASNGNIVIVYQPYGNWSKDEPWLKKWCDVRGLTYNSIGKGWYGGDYAFTITAPKKKRDVILPSVEIGGQEITYNTIANKIKSEYGLLYVSGRHSHQPYWLSIKYGKIFPREIQDIIRRTIFSISDKKYLQADVFFKLKMDCSYENLVKEEGNRVDYKQYDNS